MMRKCFGACAWVMLGCAALAGVNLMTNSGPFGGTVSCMAVDSRTPNVLYAGTATGVYKSQDWGRSWTPSSTGIQAPEIVGLLVDPVQNYVVFAGTAKTIYKSTDGGASWNQSSSGAFGGYFDAWGVDPHDHLTVYAGSRENGLFKTTDGGKSWVRRIEGLKNPSVRAMATHPSVSGELVIGSQGFGVSTSTDGGNTWKTVDIGSSYAAIYDIEYDPTNPKNMYVATELGVFKTDDGGRTWVKTSTGLTSLKAQALAVDPAAPENVYAGFSNGLFKSSDWGKTWFRAQSGMTDWDVLSLRPSPDSSGTVYAGANGGGVFKTVNGAKTWTPSSSGITGASVNSLVVDPNSDSVIVAGTSAGVFRSTDGGASWTAQNDGLQSRSVHSLIASPSSFDVLYAATPIGVFNSTDSGVQWYMSSSGLPNGRAVYALAADPSQPDVLYAGLQSGGDASVYKSTDGGQSWFVPTRGGDTAGGTQRSSALLTYDVRSLAVDAFNTRAIYAGTWGGGVFRSLDGGVSWNPPLSQIPYLSVHCIVADPKSQGFVYAGTEGGGLFSSTDGGTYWTQIGQQILPQTITTMKIFPPAGDKTNDMYVGTVGQGVYYSDDGGYFWSSVHALLEGPTVLSLARSSKAPYLLSTGTDWGVLSQTATSSPNVLNAITDPTQFAYLDVSAVSQILPASSFLITTPPSLFPSASSRNPAILEIRLPRGAVLSQTLATGELSSGSPLPLKGEKVFPLAVCQFKFNAPMSKFEPGATDRVDMSNIGRDAVQLFRYVAGEDRIWIRFVQSTISWSPPGYDVFGISLGLGSNVWPNNPASQWGEAGMRDQVSTQFFADLRNFSFSKFNDSFPVTLSAFYQYSLSPIPINSDPNPVTLFRTESGVPSETSSAQSRVASAASRFVTADLNMDGIEDFVSIDPRKLELNWAFGTRDGSWTGAGARLLRSAPATVDAADVTGDGRPDVLVADVAGKLTVYSWNTLFGKDGAAGEFAPVLEVALGVSPTASAVADVNADSIPDFLFTDGVSNTLNIRLGSSFSAASSYPSGVLPSALVASDLNGDGVADAAVANTGAGSATVYINDGKGAFTATEYPEVGTAPNSIQAADFNRDGKADLAIGSQGDTSLNPPESSALTVMMGSGTGTYRRASAQKIFFTKTLSAIQAENFDGQNGADVLVGFSDYYKLAMCLSDASGNLSHAYNLNTLPDMEVDSFSHVTLTESSVVCVASGSSAGGVNNMSGVAAVGQQPFNLVHFPRSNGLSFSVVNLGSSNMLLNAELYDDSGSFRKATTKSVGPRRQFAKYLTDLDMLGADAASETRWARGFLTGEDSYGFWLANDPSDLRYMDGAKLPNVRDAKTRFVLPVLRLAGGGYSHVILLNPSANAAQVNLKLYSSGAVKAARNITVNGRGRWSADAASAFAGIAENDYLFVESDRGLLGLVMFGDPEKLAVVEGLPTDNPAGTLYIPHVASGNLGVSFYTTLTLVNPTASAASIDIALYNDSGSVVSSVKGHPLGPFALNSLDVAALFGQGGPLSGYVAIQTNGAAGITGCVTFGEADLRRFQSCLPVLVSGRDKYIVDHIANGNPVGTTPFFTGLAVLNPNATQQTVKMSAYDSMGQLLNTKSFTVPATGRQVFMLDQKMPELTSIFGGYLILENQAATSSGMMVFALFGEKNLNFLSAIAAEPLN